MAELVYASDIGAANFCERLVYLRRNKKIKLDFLGRNIRKQILHCIAMSTDKILVDCISDGVDDMDYVKELLIRLNLPDYELMALEAVQKTLTELKYMLRENSFENVYEIVTPYAVNQKLKSNAFGLIGCVDKIFWDDNIYPVMIRCSGIPYCTWLNDKLQLTAYALLAEKKYGEKIRYGYIEYPGLQKKPVAFNETLRDEVENLKSRCEKILTSDDIPVCPHGNPKKCGSCRYEQVCYTI